MKKVTQQTETISIDNITNDSIVGIDWGAYKYQVIQLGTETFIALNNGSTVSSWSRPTKKEYIETALNKGERIRAYVFDTYKELYKWLSSD